MRYITAGESHGEALIAVIEGLPANLLIDEDFINKELKRRQGGHEEEKEWQLKRTKSTF